MGTYFAGGGDRWRGRGRATLSAFAVAAVLVTAGCGDSGEGAVTNPEKGADAEILNASIARELALLGAYTQGRTRLGPGLQPLARQLRAQQLEYVNALTKTLRGLGGDVEAEGEELDLSAVRDQADLLTRLYELESAALAAYVEVAPRLYTDAPRRLDASLAAGHAQHLVVLRQAMGAGLVESIPEAFDGGVVPPPVDDQQRPADGARAKGGG